MTDWEQLSEQIHRAMEQVDSAQQASEALKSEVTAENLDAFALELNRLLERLTSMQYALEHSDQYSMDEVIGTLSELLSGKPVQYRRSQEISLSNRKTKPRG
jgi:chromosome segregation ATPase